MSPLGPLLDELDSSLTFRDCIIMARGSAAKLAKCVTGLLTLQSVLGSPVKSEEPCPSSTPVAPTLGDGQLGAVASEAEICSHIGIELLKLGGNAADAMVGTVACVGVVGMYHSGEYIRKYCILVINRVRTWRWRLHARQGRQWHL